MGLKLRKIVIIGAGHVGTMCGLSLMYRGEVDDLVYIDIDREKAYSQALDLDDAVSLLPHQITVRTGDYGDVEDADVIVMPVFQGSRARPVWICWMTLSAS